jgi:hypothetical protein
MNKLVAKREVGQSEILGHDEFSTTVVDNEGGEVFIKVGKTFNTTANRLRGKCMPYQWRLVKDVVGSALYISKLEESLHGVLKSIRLKYAPKVKFNGARECYNVSSLYTKVLADVT